MARDVLGHIDCPTCGTVKGMRVTADRNGEPFGYCEANCSQQLRIGGDKRRVAAFVARYPWAVAKPVLQAAADAAAKPVTAPAPVPAAAPAPAAKAKPAAAKPVAAPAPEEKPRKAGVFDFLGVNP